MARVLLGVTGGIAAYKACELTRLLVKAGHVVIPLVTRGAEEFVTAKTFAALARRPAGDDPYPHLERADLLVIAPCTANTLAKLAQGIADNVLTEAALAHRGDVLVAPAMNHRMWAHPATQANVQTLVDRNVELIGPEEGELAEGEAGLGRMSEPEEIFRRIEQLLAPPDLAGKRVLVVGIGNSAVDIVSELSRKGVAEKVFLSTRSGAWVMPKYFMGRPMDTLVKINPRLPLKLQRRMARILPRLASGRMEDFGLPHPNHNFLEAHPTVSSELLLRLGSGDAAAKPDVQELDGDSVRFEDGSTEQIDVIVYATGYKITFPFFDPEFLSAPDNRFPLYKRVFKPGIDDLAFVGFAQTIPTLFPFVELQAKLVARYAGGDYALPSPAEMDETIRRDQQIHSGHYAERPRHTMQIEWYTYEHDIWTREIPAGRARAAQWMGPKLAGRVLTAEAAAA